MHKKVHKSIVADYEEDYQGVIDFNLVNEDQRVKMRREEEEDDNNGQEKPQATLKKVKHMQNILKKEGLSNKTIKENIDSFEDVPAYIRRNMLLDQKEKTSESKLSRFTLTSDDDDGPVLRENNAYLNDNVD